MDAFDAAWDSVGSGAPASVDAFDLAWESAGSSPSFVDDLPAIGARAVQGGTDLMSFAEKVNPIGQIPPIISQLFGAPAKETLGDKIAKSVLPEEIPQAQSTPGKILGEVAYLAPSALIPGGSIGSKIASVVGGGGAAGVTKALGGSEGAQAIASLFGSVAAPVGSSAISRLFGDAAKAVAPMTVEQQIAKTLGATAKDVASAGGKEGLEGAIQAGLSRGVLSGDDVAVWSSSADDAISSLGDEVSNILASADKVGKEVALPDFSKATSFIEKNPFQKEALTDQLNRRVSSLIDLWDGSVTGLNKLKQGLYKIAYSGGTDSKLLDRAIASDIKGAIESHAASTLGDEAATAVKSLNAEQGKLLTLSDLFERAMNKEAAKEMRGGRDLSILSDPVINAAGFAGSAMTGNLGPLGVAAGATLGKKILNSPAVRSATSSGLDQTSAIFRLFGGGMDSSIGPTSASLLRGINSRQSDKVPTEGKDQQLRPSENQTSFPETKEGVPKEQTNKQSQLISRLFSLSKGTPNSTVFQDKLEPLVKAVIAQESAGNPKAVSDKGAEGLMQVMPATAKGIAKELGVKEYDLKDPETNKLFGTYYLSKLLDQFNGDYELALTAYHSGPARVESLLEKTGGTTLADILPYLGPVGKKYAKQVLARV